METRGGLGEKCHVNSWGQFLVGKGLLGLGVVYGYE